MVGVILDNDEFFAAITWEDLEQMLAKRQPSFAPEFRDWARATAKKQSKTDISIDGSSFDFLSELERAGLLRTLAYTDGTPPVPREENVNPPITVNPRRRTGSSHSILAFPGMEF